MSKSNKYFTSKFFEEHKGHEEKIEPIVNQDTPDGTNGTEDVLKNTGLRLCGEIAAIRGLPQDFIATVNGYNYGTIRTQALGNNYVGKMIMRNNFAIDLEHRIIVCNALNEINILLRKFQTEPEKYDWASVSQQTMGYKDALGNCAGGRENAIKALSKYLMNWQIAKDIAANKNQNEDDQDLLKKAEEEGLRIIIQQTKEKIIYLKIDELFVGNGQSTHAVQRMKHLVYSDYGLPYAENDSLYSYYSYQEERNQIKDYVNSQEFKQELISAVSSNMANIASKPQAGENDPSKKALEKIFDPRGLGHGLMYKDGGVLQWNANIDSIIRLDSIKKMLALGIFTEEAKKKLAPLTSPSVMKLVAVLGQNIQSNEEREGFVFNSITCEYEKPNSGYQLPPFYSYDDLIAKLSEAKKSGKCEHFKEKYVQDLLTQVIAEQDMKLHLVCNIDSYQITRLAYMIVDREKSGEEVSYRDLSSVLKYTDDFGSEKPIKLTKEHLHKIAKEVERIEKKNGFTRTLEECYYAVIDFFRAILGMSTLDKQTKRDCENFLYVKEGASDKNSFIDLVGFQRENQQEQQV